MKILTSGNLRNRGLEAVFSGKQIRLLPLIS